MKYKHFSIEEREKIQLLWWQKSSIRAIAKDLNRSPASVSRELNKNLSEEKKRYTPRLAHTRALAKRKCRGRKDRLKSEKIRQYVIKHLHLRWSPEQISNRLRIDLKENISHEAIYRFVYSRVSFGSNNTKPGLEDLRPYLRRRRRIRQPHGARKYQRVFAPKANSIDERPVIVNQRLRVGDWEGDTVESVNHRPGINTLVERKVGLVMISRLKSKKSFATTEVVRNRFNSIPLQFKQTLTLDNGAENSGWQNIEKQTGLKCYQAHPYCSGERGTNENTNGLIRDYFPKKTNFSMISDDEIQYVENQLNNRPRKRLNWLTPLEAWSVALQG